MEYKLVQVNTSFGFLFGVEKLEKEVNSLIKKGWSPISGFTVTKIAASTFLFYSTNVKEAN